MCKVSHSRFFRGKGRILGDTRISQDTSLPLQSCISNTYRPDQRFTYDEEARQNQRGDASYERHGCNFNAGDLVNNCDPMQYDRLAAILEETVPDKPIFAVAGNHDIPDGQTQNYRHFEQWLHGRTRKTYTVTDSGSGAFVVMLNPGLDLIGLNPLYARKIFHFPDKGEQLKWLRQYLEDSPAGQHIIMCHAPLLAHNPQRDSGKDSPYLAQDMILQDIVDRKKKIIFISGHTHLSPNVPSGCVDYDSVKENLYINDGSVCPVDLKSPEVILPSEWSDGCYTEMMVYKDSMEIIMRYLRSGKRISRGYYNIPIVSS